MSDLLPTPQVLRADIRIQQLLQDGLHAAAAARVIGPVPMDIEILVERPKNPEHGDWSSNLALRIARFFPGQSPMQLAEILMSHIETHDIIGSISVAAPGFLNFTLSKAFVLQQLFRLAASPTLGVHLAPLPAKIIIDYSAPNVAKEMHVGHLRSTIIGDALSRILIFLGHTVVRENHIGDWGTPFGMLIEHLRDVGGDQTTEGFSVGDLTAFYRAGREKFDTDPAFKERSQQRVVALQSGDEETLRLWKILVEASLSYFDVIYQELDVQLTRTDVVGESFYNPMLKSVVEDLGSIGLLVESEGAQCVFPTGFANRDGSPLPLIIQKSDGGFGYAATDLAAIRDRVGRQHADRILVVVGTPQAQHFAMCFAVATMANWLPPTTKAEHVNFGQILGEDHKTFKSRTGETVRLHELVDEAIDRASTAITERTPDMDPAEHRKLAHDIGIGAIKYADLSNDRIKDYVFDWDRMLSFEGNTGPYLQYAHARICSIFRKSVREAPSPKTVITLDAPDEQALAQRLLDFDAVIEETLSGYHPHVLCTYLYELASTFTGFYERCPVLTAGSEELTTSRLALCSMTARILAKGLGLLGISAPERM